LENPQKYGFYIQPEQLYFPTEYDIVEINTEIEDWPTWAKEYGISYAQLREQNPWIQAKSLTNKSGKTYKIKSGTKIELILINTITDRMPKGSSVSFKAKNGFVAKDGTIIPAGTILKGVVKKSHGPQITGNGGLIAIEVNEIYFNGVRSKIETKLRSANSKKVFFNKIKGERKYWKNYAKVMKPGQEFFNETQRCASAMAVIPVVNLVSFVPLLAGALFYTVSFVSAPVISVFKKGGRLNIPSGTVFDIKLTETVEIRG
jgi:hypothetical protein